MKKLKFIGFLVTLMVMVTSFTSCLSNSDDSTSNNTLTALVSYEGVGTFKSLDGNITYVASNPGSSFQTGALYYLYFTYNTTTTGGTTSKAEDSTTPTTYYITIVQGQDGSLGAYKVGGGFSINERAVDLESFKNDTTILKDSLKNEASFISLSDLTSTTDSNSGFYLWNNSGNYTLLTGMNYYFNIPNQNSKTALQDVLNSNKLYLYYDESEFASSNGTLHLYLKRFTTPTPTKDQTVVVSYGYGVTFQHPQLYYKTFSISEALSAYQRTTGNTPTTIKVTANINQSDWKVQNGTAKDYSVSMK